MKVVIPGGTGQVGAILTRAFVREDHEVVLLSRSQTTRKDARVVLWDGSSAGDWAAEVDGADVLINLAGYTVNCRYNKENRERIMSSRVNSTRALGEAVAAAANPPPVWLNASTATIYRHALDRPMDEIDGELGGNEPDAPEKWNFSIDVAKAWEDTFFAIDTPRTRKVAMRSAMTMSPDRGGVFDVMLGLVRVGLGGRNGSGDQFVSWVHEQDFVRAVNFLIEHDDIDGTVNICSPNPMRNREFMHQIRKAWGMPFGPPAFEWMLEIGAVFLRTETELILKSRRVVPRRLQEAGFEFQYPGWPEAVGELVSRMKR